MDFLCPKCKAAGHTEWEFAPFVLSMTPCYVSKGFDLRSYNVQLKDVDTNSYYVQLKCKHGHIYEGRVEDLAFIEKMRADRERTDREINKAIMGYDDFPDWPPGS